MRGLAGVGALGVLLSCQSLVVEVLALQCTPGLSGDLCCSLNGKFVAGKCECDEPWSGPRCGTVDVFPKGPAAQPGGTYGFSPNVSSWGGNALLGDDGLQHMFVAEIPGGLRTWGSQSQCVHATSPNISGPYTRHDLVLGPECHNPSTLRHPQTGEWLMFHIGAGPDTDDTTSGQSFLHTAKNPNGPWTAAKTAPNSCNNPAPAYHPNGTLFVVCNHLDITMAIDDYTGTWTALRTMGHPGNYSRAGNWEDPYLWFDKRGNFHVVYHVYCLDPFEAHNECNAGHAFSIDGYTWHFGQDEPYSGLVSFADGTNTTFSTRERPHMIFADKARTTPVGVFTAVSNQPISPACAGCNSHACSQCKVTPGRDWTFNQLQPFIGFKEGGPYY